MNRTCTRCGGQLALESDIYGDYLNCRQCGANFDLDKSKEPIKPEIKKLSQGDRRIKLSGEDRERVWQRLASGESSTVLAREYKVSHQTIYRCAKEAVKERV